MSEKDISKRKLWPYTEANKVLKQHKHNPDRVYTFETGFGPSGFPHIGTFGEVVRTEFIINALKDAGYRTRLVVFSDDLDGLRKVPDDMPAWLGEYLGKPVSAIPDPYGECESFSAHMNQKLEEMLNWMEIDYEFRSSKQCYDSGDFDEAIKILLSNYSKLEKIIAPTLSKETLKDWYPFFPICENCGSVLTTLVRKVNTEDYTIDYSCAKTHGSLQGCGHEGTRSALKGRGKMTWRVDWPMRWYALGIDYELYGKDLIESFKIGKRIMNQVFRVREPENMFYEMFLDETGAKISKSKGKGLTVDGWLKYGTAESLYLLMYRRPRKAKELSFNIIPSYVDDVIALSSNYHAKPEAEEHEFRFITRFRPEDKVFPKISYMLICNLMTALKSDDPELIRHYLSQQKELGDEDLRSDFLNQMIEKAARFYHDFIAGKKHEIDLSEEDILLLNQFTDLLRNEGLSSEDIHNSVYTIARDNGKNPRDFFRIIYLVFIGQDRGPRLGNFVKMIGQKKSIEIIVSSLKALLKQ